MARLQCPHCGELVDSREGWAKSALATLLPAPSVPAMATQLRCPVCRAVFSQMEGSLPGTWSGLWPGVLVLAVLLAVALFLPG